MTDCPRLGKASRTPTRVLCGTGTRRRGAATLERTTPHRRLRHGVAAVSEDEPAVTPRWQRQQRSRWYCGHIFFEIGARVSLSMADTILQALRQRHAIVVDALSIDATICVYGRSPVSYIHGVPVSPLGVVAGRTLRIIHDSTVAGGRYNSRVNDDAYFPAALACKLGYIFGDVCRVDGSFSPPAPWHVFPRHVVPCQCRRRAPSDSLGHPFRDCCDSGNTIYPCQRHDPVSRVVSSRINVKDAPRQIRSDAWHATWFGHLFGEYTAVVDLLMQLGWRT